MSARSPLALSASWSPLLDTPTPLLPKTWTTASGVDASDTAAAFWTDAEDFPPKEICGRATAADRNNHNRRRYLHRREKVVLN
jgi:hypothetical protein